jgi:hypothetical protein
MLRTSLRLGIYFLLFCLMVVGASSSFAQTGTTSLRGTITDKSGAAIVGAKVTLSNAEAGFERTTESGGTGQYEFLLVPPGTYSLAVTKENFNRYTQTNVQLLVNLPGTQSITLQVGSATQTVEVSAQLETLNTTDASLGNAFNENQVRQLPMEGRNVPDLLSLQPGVAYPNNRDDVPSWDTRRGAVNGARSDQSNVSLDGVAVNDQGGNAFTSVLPVTLDSVQEFRVTTSNYNADQGGTSGAQVSLVTKSGTNAFHGSAYEYHRNTISSANDYFVKGAQIQTCLDNGIPLDKQQCNNAPKLIRNIFGGSLGGPIKKDRLYFFLNYEGTRRAEGSSQSVVVPTNTMKDGIIQYACAPILDANGNVMQTAAQVCPGGTVNGLTGNHSVQAGYYAMSPTQLTGIDPLGLGPNTAVLQYLNSQWPNANSNSCGDGYNYGCYTFSSPISETKDEYIAKMDYNITKDARHHVSVMGALRNDTNPGAQFLPGQLPSQTLVNYNKGIVVNYNGVIRSNLINSFRYGYVRESVGVLGNSTQDWIYLRGLNDQAGAVTRSHSYQRPINTFADDVSWIKGKHTWQFGTLIGITRTPSNSYSSSYSDGSANASWTDTSGYAQKSSSPLNPSNYCPGGNCLPTVDASFANSYDFPLTAMLGMVSEVDARYNFTRNGTALPDGAALQRRFAINSYEFYGQDVWKVKPTLTLTLGLRYSLFSPPWETNKLQVCPTQDMGQWFLGRGAAGANGIPSNQDPSVAFDWCGKANGKDGYYNWDKKNLGPRFAFAWAPQYTDGLLGDVLGRGKTSIRGGFAMVFDRFGQGIANDFSQYGSFGLSTELTNPAGFQTVSSAPRLKNMNIIPTTDNNGGTIFQPAPPSVFPQTFPSGNFYIGSTIDKGLKTPYAFTMDFSVARELKGGFTVEASYVGRLGRRLLTQLDAATPLNLKDPKTGVDYFTAATALAKIYRGGTQSQALNPSQLPANISQYWADVMSPLASGDSYQLSSCTGTDQNGNPNVFSTTSAAVAVYDTMCGNSLNETTGLLILDYYGLSGTSGNSYLPRGGQYTFYNPQFATFYMFKSMSNSNYNAMQLSLKHQMSHGVQFDFNYTFSKSIDLASDAERVGTIGGNAAQVQNAWSPNQFRAVSDFDTTHQFTADWVVDLPFGKGKTFGGGANRFEDAFIGGWQVSGLMRLTSGFPFYVTNGYQWPTDWDLSGNGYQTGPVTTGAFKDPTNGTVVNAFKAGAAVQGSFVEPFPGQAGQRNNLRGQGFFGIDMGLSKRWIMPWSEKQSVQFRWEVFNITNSVRFDPLSVNAVLDYSGSTFGQYTRLNNKPRVMQFALRYEF